MQIYRETTHTKPADRVYQWHVIDADGERLGRLASRIAVLLMGKHKPDYSRHQLAGDFVIVVNAVKVGFSGNKRAQKIYYRHTGYIGHLRERTLDEMMAKFPTRVIEQAVKGMLPRNRLGRQMLRRLKVYAEAEHPHEAQVRAGLGKAKEEPAAPTRAPRRPSAEAVQAPVAPAAPEAEPQVAEAPAEAPAAEAATPARRRTTRRAAPKAPKAETTPKKAAATTRRRAPAAAKDAAESPAPRRRTRRAPASEGPKPEGE